MSPPAGPRVSAVIIFLDAERFLEEAIRSVLAQRLGDWELLLVDDGSTDGSTAIARRYAAEYAGKVHYLEHEGHRNLGMSASRNAGVARARGEHVAFLDADDVWLPHKLGEQVGLLARHPEAGMVYGRSLIWHSWTGMPADRRRDFCYDLGVPQDTLVPAPDLLPLLLANKVQLPLTCNLMVRRRLFDELGGFEASFPGMYEDQVFYTKVLLKAPVFVAGACWARYRQHEDSCVARADRGGAYPANRLPLLRWMATYLAAEGVDEASPAWRALRRALWWALHPRWYRLHVAAWQCVRQVRGN